MVSRSYIAKFVRIAKGNLSYNDPSKQEFHRMGKRILKEVAIRMGLVAGEFSIRSNLAGIAGSGEVILHANRVYIQFGQSSLGDTFMYRSCRGQKDYTGGQNRWMGWDVLLDLDRAVAAFKACQDMGS